MRLRFHGSELEVRGDSRAVNAAMELLGGLPADLGQGEPDLLVVRSPPEGPRRFYHGIVDCHGGGEGVVVTEQARIPRGGRLIEVDVAEGSLVCGYLFAHVLLLVSLVLALRWRGLFHLHAGALIESNTLVVIDGLPGAEGYLDMLRRVADGVRGSRLGSGLHLLARPVDAANRLLRALR